MVDARLDFITHNVSRVNDGTDEPPRVSWGSEVAPWEPVEKQLVVGKV